MKVNAPPGKSTLMKALTGAYQPDEGEILFDGRWMRFLSPPRCASLEQRDGLSRPGPGRQIRVIP